jgi:hypothetical protein
MLQNAAGSAEVVESGGDKNTLSSGDGAARLLLLLLLLAWRHQHGHVTEGGPASAGMMPSC